MFNRWKQILLSALPLLFLGGCGTPSFLITPVNGPHELDEIVIKPGRAFGPKIAIIEVEGTLVDARSGGFMQPSENPLSQFVEELDRAASDDSVKAVVLRVNSPGGSVTASDTMYDALLRFKAKTHKPVVASAQEVMASGAYYVSCGADKIVVNPTSIVGSIGVIFESFEFADTLQKIGAKVTAIKSAEFKDMGSPFKHLTDPERDIMQGMVDEYFARFQGIVKKDRPVSSDADQFKTLTDGRVFSGEKAVELGLADQVGRLDDAIGVAAQLANTNNPSIIMYKHSYSDTGSIYAETSVPAPKSNATVLELPINMSDMLPTGFYYIWQPN